MIAQKKHLDALNATQKTTALYDVQFLKKSRITAKNAIFFIEIHIFSVQGLWYCRVSNCRRLIRLFALMTMGHWGGTLSVNI